jgi:hypothetical protein
MDEHTKQLITMLNDMYQSQGDEYKSRYRENYFELLQHLVSPRVYISGGEIIRKYNDLQQKRMNYGKDRQQTKGEDATHD